MVRKAKAANRGDRRRPGIAGPPLVSSTAGPLPGFQSRSHTKARFVLHRRRGSNLWCPRSSATSAHNHVQLRCILHRLAGIVLLQERDFAQDLRAGLEALFDGNVMLDPVGERYAIVTELLFQIDVVLTGAELLLHR